MREPEGDVTGLVEAGHNLWRQVDLEAREVVGELLRAQGGVIPILGARTASGTNTMKIPAIQAMLFHRSAAIGPPSAIALIALTT